MTTQQADEKIDPTLDGGTIQQSNSDAATFEHSTAADINDVGIPPVNAPKAGASKTRKLVTLLVAVGVLAAVGLGLNRCTQVASDLKNSLRDRKANASASPSEAVSEFPADRPLPGASAPIVGIDREDSAAAPSSAASNPIRGANGQVLTGPAGRPLVVDGAGKVVEVPPLRIATVDAAAPTTAQGKKPLPVKSNQMPSAQGGQPAAVAGDAGQGTANGAAQPKPPSRYGGSLYADGIKADGAAAAGKQKAQDGQMPPANAELLRQLIAMQQGGQRQAGADATGAAFNGQQESKGASPSAQPGSIGQQLGGSSTPPVFAVRDRNPSLLLPKGRQADCAMTSRVVNELPGFCSCVLTQDLYSSDGTVLLAERGTQMDGEYGIAGAIGNRRLFMIWNRGRTPGGVTIDLQSPATDTLGTSGVEGYLENRWFDRIGAAMMISVMKDVIAIEQAKRTPPNTNSTGNYSNSVQAGQQLAEQVLKQTINIRPTLYINEGERIGIYVARDIDFSNVYRLANRRSGGQ